MTFNLLFVICERIYSEKVLSVCDTRLTPPIVPYSSIWLQEHTQKKRCFPLWVKEENHLFHVCLGSNIREESWNWWGGVIYCEFSLSFDVTHMCSRAGQYICLVETNFGSFWLFVKCPSSFSLPPKFPPPWPKFLQHKTVLFIVPIPHTWIERR